MFINIIGTIFGKTIAPAFRIPVLGVLLLYCLQSSSARMFNVALLGSGCCEPFLLRTTKGALTLGLEEVKRDWLSYDHDFRSIDIKSILTLSEKSSSARTFNVALIASESSLNLGLRTNKGALTLGLEEVKRDWLSHDHEFRIAWADSQNNRKLALGYAHEFINNQTDIIFGSPSSTRNIPIALLTGFLNIPHITWVSTDPELGDKTLFNTLVRTIGHFGKIGPAVVAIFKKFGWSRIGLFYPESGYRGYSVDGLRAAFKEYNMTIAEKVTFPASGLDEAAIIAGLNSLKKKARIIFLSTSDDTKRTILLKARELEMCNGEYVFLTPNLLNPDGDYRPWYRGDGLDQLALEAYKRTLDLSLAKGSDDIAYRQLVALKTAEAPFYDNWAITNNETGSKYSPYLHDAAVLWGMWLNYSLTNNLDTRDGRGLFNFTQNAFFIGKSGPVHFDSSGDRQPSYAVSSFNYNDGIATIIAIVDTSSSIDQSLRIYSPFRWLTADGLPPPDVPPCGFEGEHCIEESDTTIILVSALIPSLTVCALVLGWFEWRRRKKLEEELLKGLAWRINIDDITRINGNLMNSCKSLVSLSHASRLFEEDTASTRAAGTVGIYQGIHVFWKEMTSDKFTLNREILLDLKCMKELSHENVNPFIGASITGLQVVLVYKFCKKLSLQDILENDGIQLDWMFKFSFISDIIAGMYYLHGTRLNSHGRLTSSNCLIDGRWVLKISDYGISHFISKESDQSKNLNKELWTAPELLRLPDRRGRGTPAGDVYSFGIILNEIYYRNGAFSTLEEMETNEIIKRVQNVETPPFRPPKGFEPDIPKTMIKLLDYCLEENPNERPPFSEIRKYTRTHNKDQQGGIMDLMVKKLEKYASNLEEIVEVRTVALIEEKKKTDALLNRMLPPSIAEKLKKAESIDPEYFDQVTIYFSDIVGFTTISAKSKPMEIVDLLNDLYTTFDSIIDKYDAYKVETIGDAYMVCSGLPIRNGMQHAAQIGSMALDILSCLLSFRIRHIPNDKLKIRIGFHTGPCCAGVVGYATPKYCLFGDTVNTASRMESHGESMRIQISEVTKGVLEVLGGFTVKLRGQREIKGKGLMTTYWLVGKAGFVNELPDVEMW